MSFRILPLTIFLTCVTPFSGWASGRCIGVLSHQYETPLTSTELVELMDLANWQVRNYSTNIPGDQGSPTSIKEVQYTNGAQGTVHRVLVNFFSKDNIQDSISDSNSDAAFARFRQAKIRALNFVIRSYEARRMHWPSEFREKLRRLADEYERESTYISVEKPFLRQEPMPELDASIRLITEKNGRIPMEDYLNIRLKTAPNQIKIEPGNFAINSGANEISWMEVGSHLLAQDRRIEEETGRVPVYTTYADAFSERLYRNLGFEYLRAEDVEVFDSSNMRVRKDGTIIFHKDGVDWAPLKASRFEFNRHMWIKATEASGRRIQRGHAISTYRIQQNLFALSGIIRMGLLSAQHRFSGEAMFNGELEKMDVYIGRRSDENNEIFINSQDFYGVGLSYFGSSIVFPGPLRDGYKHDLSPQLRDMLGSVVDRLLISYDRGILKIEEVYLSNAGSVELTQTYSITIDPELRHASRIEISRVRPNTAADQNSFRHFSLQ